MNAPYGGTVLLDLAVMHHSHTRALNPALMLFNVIGLQQDHVSALAPAALDKPARCGTRLLRCGNLQELVTDGVKTMPQSK